MMMASAPSRSSHRLALFRADEFYARAINDCRTTRDCLGGSYV